MVEPAQAVTVDGLKLDGALYLPAAGEQAPLPVDAFLVLHGTGGNFYGSTLTAGLAPRMASWGAAVLAVNTRGHDLAYMAGTNRGRKLQGSSHELVDECRFDIAAWTDWLQARGMPRIVLVGHSLGAVKALYAMAQDDPPPVARVAALSPPRLSHAHFSQSARAERFLAEHAQAENMVREGRGEATLDATVPLPYPITAASYVDKYGVEERYNILRFVDRVRAPVLFTFGTLELRSEAFAGLPEALAPAGGANPVRQVAVIGGADHVYTGVQLDLAARIESWLRRPT